MFDIFFVGEQEKHTPPVGVLGCLRVSEKPVLYNKAYVYNLSMLFLLCYPQNSPMVGLGLNLLGSKGSKVDRYICAPSNLIRFRLNRPEVPFMVRCFPFDFLNYHHDKVSKAFYKAHMTRSARFVMKETTFCIYGSCVIFIDHRLEQDLLCPPSTPSLATT